MNIVKEAREKKGYNQSELARITFASLGLAEIPRIDAINISQTVSVLKLLLTLAMSTLILHSSQQHSKTRNGIEPSNTPSLPRKRMSNRDNHCEAR